MLEGKKLFVAYLNEIEINQLLRILNLIQISIRFFKSHLIYYDYFIQLFYFLIKDLNKNLQTRLLSTLSVYI